MSHVLNGTGFTTGVLSVSLGVLSLVMPDASNRQSVTSLFVIATVLLAFTINKRKHARFAVCLTFAGLLASLAGHFMSF